MNKLSTILNPDLARAVTTAGHFDELVIADCGLPIPSGPTVIDLSVRRGLPSFEEVFLLIMKELKVERVVIAGEIKSHNPPVLSVIKAEIERDSNGGKIELDEVTHNEFKHRCASAKWIVRTGENTPYANIILVAGVSF
jgi:D-ribose pyranase